MPPTLGAGLGLKPEHYDAALACTAEAIWFEVHPENYFVDGGPRLAWLDAIRGKHPLSLHGVSLSLAADVPPERRALDSLAALVRRFEPALVSEHLAWSAWRGVYYPDLFPFPRTSDALARIADNIALTQDVLGRAIAIENPSHYLRIEDHAWGEADFLTELTRRTGCGLLLDVNNVYVSANNLGYDARAYLDSLPALAIMEIHLAGHSVDGEAAGLLVDSHDAPVAPEVWALYAYLIAKIGPRPTLVERDGNIPPFASLMDERAMAQAVLDRHVVRT
ncbi:MNIO family bufferin maturase [Massilia glaciei]|uniref:DUF692 domain-containing protein n=1 Tax=Massilia glaciei TaxID=1524097 RepID=A0A2U2HEH1_9BURK|nr:DUF692 domain-containing protein [Massilia glaciei]PWF41779.1 DUF692 domain-containing protein [Massilia glaciei]